MAERTIPTIDLTALRSGSEAQKREVARQIDEACCDTGFFLVTGHGVPADLIAKARQRAIDFFALPEDEKMKVQRPPSKISRGFNWIGDRAIAYSMGEKTPPDIQEAFGFGNEAPDLAAKVDPVSAQMYAPNIWPQRPDDFRETMVSYYDEMEGLARRVLGAMAMALGLNENYFVDKFDRQASNCRIIRYPAVKEDTAAGAASRRHPHRLWHHDLRARRRHAGRSPGPASQRRLDRSAHSGRRLRLQHRRHDDALVERPLGLDPASRRGAAAGRQAAGPHLAGVLYQPECRRDHRVHRGVRAPGETPKYPPVTVSEHYLGKLMRAGHSKVEAKAADALTH